MYGGGERAACFFNPLHIQRNDPMPLKLNVGLAKKVGLPDYGSLCASCHVECELDAMLLASDLNRFQEHVRNVFVACSQAVHDELSRQRNANGDGQAANTSRPRTTAAAARSAPTAKPPTNGQSHHASSKQLEYARPLAGQIRELGVGQLDQLASKMTEHDFRYIPLAVSIVSNFVPV
jgi:hypothetical protein